MKHFSENDLIAYHLDELSQRRKRDLERALETDAALAAESDSVRMTLRGFKDHSPFDLDPRLDEGLMQWNWQVLSSVLPRYPARSPAFLRRHLPALAGAGLAFAAITVTLVRWHHLHAVPGGTGPQPSIKAPGSTLSRQDTAPVPATPQERAAIGQNMQAKAKARHLSAADADTSIAPVRQAHHTDLLRAPGPPVEQPQQTQLATVMPLPSSTPAQTPAPESTAALAGMSSSAPSEPANDSQTQASASGPDNAKRGRSTVHHNHTTELTLAMGGTLIGYNDNDVSAYRVNRPEGATNAIIAMALLHQQFRPAAGYRIALSYSRPDFHYSGVSSINGKLYEAAATYVIQGPGRGKLSTSAEAGVGLMRITPTIKDPATGSNIRAAGVFGVAADLMLSRHIGIHAAYRGQVFKAPDFQYRGDQYSNYSTPITAGTLLSNEPSLGITYRFSRR